MATVSESMLRERAAQVTAVRRKAARQVLEEATVTKSDSFDVFLSYSSGEPPEFILGVREFLRDHDLVVYIDKFDDPSMTPDTVTKETAETLRARLRQSKALLFLHSSQSPKSKWMPWELGFFDAYRSKVAVFPVTSGRDEKYSGQEYLGIYPYVDRRKARNSEDQFFWVWDGPNYARFDLWVKGKAKIEKR